MDAVFVQKNISYSSFQKNLLSSILTNDMTANSAIDCNMS